ncbi:MAG: DUF3828 domain-containing protein, partial [Caulobacteraceae bacterium]
FSLEDMKTSGFVVLAFVSGVVLTSTVWASDLAGARAFLTELYSHYPASVSASKNPTFDPVGRSATAVFEPSMVGLIREDQRLSKGEVGALDGDPICDCQDDGGMVVEKISVRSVDPSHATAIVALKFTEARPPDTHIIQIDLVLRADRWRIHDVRTKSILSLRRLLIESNRSASRATSPALR